MLELRERAGFHIAARHLMHVVTSKLREGDKPIRELKDKLLAHAKDNNARKRIDDVLVDNFFSKYVRKAERVLTQDLEKELEGTRSRRDVAIRLQRRAMRLMDNLDADIDEQESRLGKTIGESQKETITDTIDKVLVDLYSLIASILPFVEKSFDARQERIQELNDKNVTFSLFTTLIRLNVTQKELIDDAVKRVGPHIAAMMQEYNATYRDVNDDADMLEVREFVPKIDSMIDRELGETLYEKLIDPAHTMIEKAFVPNADRTYLQSTVVPNVANNVYMKIYDRVLDGAKQYAHEQTGEHAMS